MTDTFISENFLLQNDRAVRLYHEYARRLPIVDYHCHLPPEQVAEDRRFENLTQIWLYGDHYKWRAMRAAGVPERYCTGNAPDWEKFEKWAEIVPQTLRNPLYHWTHLELKRPLGIGDRLLGPKTAEGIWRQANAALARPEFSARGIMRQMNVVLVCTTDDPIDTLEHHRRIAADRVVSDPRVAHLSPRPGDGRRTRRRPSTRGSNGSPSEAASTSRTISIAFWRPCGSGTTSFTRSAAGCPTTASTPSTRPTVRTGRSAALFRRLHRGERLSAAEIAQFKSAMLYQLAVMNAEKGWVQQFHFGAMRNNNTRMFQALGPDCGFDSIGDGDVARPMARFFDRLDRDGRLTKTILYNLNPAHNDVVATMIGNFQDGVTPGKMQYGSGWWFLDQKDGMERQLNSLSNQGLLSRFVGMLTDSRSFLSYTRHEYFRRILCNLLGTEMQQGLLPDEPELIGSMVRDICYGNAARYFGFDLPRAAGS